MIKKILYRIAALLGALAVVSVFAYYWLVVWYPGEEIEQNNIKKIL